MWATLRRPPGIAAQNRRAVHSRFDPRIIFRWRRRKPYRSCRDQTALRVESLDYTASCVISSTPASGCLQFYQTEMHAKPTPPSSSTAPDRRLPLPKRLYEILRLVSALEGVHCASQGARVASAVRTALIPHRGTRAGEPSGQNAVIVPVGQRRFVPKQLPPVRARRCGLGHRRHRSYPVCSHHQTGPECGSRTCLRHDMTIRSRGCGRQGTATFWYGERISLGMLRLGDAFAPAARRLHHKKMVLRAGSPGSCSPIPRDGLDIAVRRSRSLRRRQVRRRIRERHLRELTIKLVASSITATLHRFRRPGPGAQLRGGSACSISRARAADYNKASLAAGFYSRKANEIALRRGARALLTLEGETFTPQQLMTAILNLNTDCCGSADRHLQSGRRARATDQVGDRVNDPSASPAACAAR